VHVAAEREGKSVQFDLDVSKLDAYLVISRALSIPPFERYCLQLKVFTWRYDCTTFGGVTVHGTAANSRKLGALRKREAIHVGGSDEAPESGRLLDRHRRQSCTSHLCLEDRQRERESNGRTHAPHEISCRCVFTPE
jgi:hypothetical protein